MFLYRVGHYLNVPKTKVSIMIIVMEVIGLQKEEVYTWVNGYKKNLLKERKTIMKILLLTLSFLLLNACSTSLAIIDAASSTAIYAGKTVVNTIDTITPDIINKD